MGRSCEALKIVNRLNVLRAEHRITQEKLAKEVGVTRATIVAIEKGDYNPSLGLAFRIARYFKRDINDIFSVEEEEK
ncbi:MAG: antitoxin HipB [Syntrophorhabdus sp. PtaB.Bin047]|jgi:putative transcriptional regulator|nr:MAG: antitoxin HipB [Syntrophorhabdus sp. PtaB.Bin047]